ncbi:hypothetical protein [Mycobacterium sp. DBP42]|uniref:hypothetical protein n=1 Tax=Mycobacteriaceae TaxID=1762 RepID=UPI00110D10E6|nr:hypothetical protein [Mycobacterium sp. DBP42]TMS50697.1 hypothetical protein E0T84_22690 [Mycobacterium sp. DBP42]
MPNLQTLATANVSTLATDAQGAAVGLLYFAAGVLAVAATCVWAAAMLVHRHRSPEGDGPGERGWRTTVENVATMWLALRLGVAALVLAMTAMCLPALTDPTFVHVCACTHTGTFS